MTGLPAASLPTISRPSRAFRSSRPSARQSIAITSEAAVMSKPSSRGTPLAGPPRPITVWRRKRSFMSMQRCQLMRSRPCLKLTALSQSAESRLLAEVIACRSPVQCMLMRAAGSTLALPPPVPPPLAPKTGPSDGSRSAPAIAHAAPPQPLHQADGGGGLALAVLGRRHRRDQHQLAARRLLAELLEGRPGGLGEVVAVEIEVVRVEVEGAGHVGDRFHGRRTSHKRPPMALVFEAAISTRRSGTSGRRGPARPCTSPRCSRRPCPSSAPSGCRWSSSPPSPRPSRRRR